MYTVIFDEFVKFHTYPEQFAAAHAEHEDAYFIYVIREGATVFYVGKVDPSIAVASGLEKMHRRVMAHYWNGGHPEKAQKIDYFLRMNEPASRSWPVDLLNQRDCETTTGHAFWDGGRHLVDELERAMIRYYHPCLNMAHNPNPTPLPSTYRSRFDQAWAHRAEDKAP